MLNILVAIALLIVPICSFQLQVSSIECTSRDSITVHFIANQSDVNLEGNQVEFVMNGNPYVAPWTKTAGSAYHFSTVISVTGALTETITEAYIQYGSVRVDAHNLPYQKWVNCNPTGITLTALSARTDENAVLYFLSGVVLGLFLFTMFLIARNLRK